MKKKTLRSVAMLLLLTLAVSACSQSGGGDATTGGSETTVPVETDTSGSTDTGATETEPVDEAAAMPEYSFDDGSGNYQRVDDEEVYEWALGEYSALLAEAKEDGLSIDERFVRMAKAEAALLDSAVMIPTTTQGGRFAISRVAPRTIPYVQWGNDDDRWFGMVIADDFIKPEDREALLELWRAAAAGEGEYDPAAYLTEHGYGLKNEYVYSFNTAPVTIDWLNTSSQADTEITVQTVTGLVQYNNLSQMEPALAESWEVSEDGLTYTFHIRKGVMWYTSEGAEYAEVTAHDFEAGFHHMLDTQAGLEWLVEGVITGVGAYMYEGGSFDDVGYKAIDDYTLEVTLEKPTSYFLTMLTYSVFLPMCDSFYQSRGGVYGVAEYAEASADTNTYTFGMNTDVSSQVYCGPFLLQKLQPNSEIVVVRNKNYYNDEKTTLESIKWIYDNGDNPTAMYNDTVSGVYAGINLLESTGTMALAKEDGNFEKYAYITDTTSTSYFGGLNLNRGTFELESGAVKSPKTEQEKIDTTTALQNKNFRQALQFAFDKATYNATSNGEELKNASLRNMYTHPEFVALENDVTVDGASFAAGTFYGEIVQYYLDEIGSPIKVADSQDGWFNPTVAKEKLEAAKAELEGLVTFPIKIDVVYYSARDWDVAGAQAYKAKVEETLGADNVVVNLVEASVQDDFYASGYRASNGEAGNFDMFYGSGWGPDYGDPSTYLDTFLGEGAGYMTKVIGLF